MKLTFMGGVGTVTGSKYLLDTDDGNRTLIDCGLFQGYKELRLRNWWELPVAARDIDNVILTHAHLDHSGYIPLLIKRGFRKRIYCSFATLELCKLLLPDSGYLQEEDAKRANLYGYTKHHPAQPLYTEKDAEHALEHFFTVNYHTEKTLYEGFTFNLFPAGHILGASSVLIKNKGKSILFSGDIGRLNDPILYPPETPDTVDYIVMESTYGNRIHEKKDPLDEIAEVINTTIERGGSIVIPAFAVGRAQHMLYYIHQLKVKRRISAQLPIYLDSPMAISATEIFARYAKEHRLSQEMCNEIGATAKYIRNVEASKAIDHNHFPSVIISASGMATGGRILHHLKSYAPNPKNTILFTGYQAGGTRGDRMIKGEKEIKIHGEMVPVRAEIRELHNTSAHADAEELLQWLGQFKKPPRKVFITHGEAEAAEALKQKVEERFGYEAVIPTYLQTEEL